MLFDIILIFSILVLIILIINTYLYKLSDNCINISNDFNSQLLSNNIILDDDIIIINDNLKNKDSLNNSKNINKLSNFDNNNSNKINIIKHVNELYDIPTKNLDNSLLENKINNNLDNNNLISTTTLLPKNESKLNNRYNRKFNNNPNENELYNIRNYQINHLINNEDDNTKQLINNNNLLISNISNNIDSKIFTKTNKSQKLFKDSKTIQNRFTKDSILNDYKSELDYYQNLRTPWWEENID
jgi:hypothetical protein